MLRSPMKMALCVATLLAWLGFIYLGRETYGEIYGPLTILRPIAMYLALTLSLTSGVCLALSKQSEPKSLTQ
jgi:hypothetical protein